MVLPELRSASASVFDVPSDTVETAPIRTAMIPFEPPLTFDFALMDETSVAFVTTMLRLTESPEIMVLFSV